MIANEPSRCLASHLMGNLLLWRNPHANFTPAYEYRHILLLQRLNDYGNRISYKFFENKRNIGAGKIHFLKVSITEFLLAIPLVVGLVEVIAYSALALLSLAFSPITSRPFRFFADQFESSIFSIRWAIASGCYYNLFTLGDVPIHESDARSRIGWFRKKDDDSIKLLVRNIRDLVPIVLEEVERLNTQANRDNSAVQLQNIEAGSQFLLNDTLADTDEVTKEAFRNVDTEAIEFVCAKAFFIFCKGSKCQEEIPSFFNQRTIETINQLRNDPQITSLSLTECEQAFRSLQTFRENNVLVRPFKSLAGHQNSLLLTLCWQNAISLLTRHGQQSSLIP